MDKEMTGSGRISVVSEHVVLEGEITGEENLHIFGQIRGSIRISGDILVGKTGKVEADVEATNISVDGTIQGNALAREHLEIQSTGTMIGDITARSIDIKEGSSFEGRSRMLRRTAGSAGSGESAAKPAAPTVDTAAGAPENGGETMPKNETGGPE